LDAQPPHITALKSSILTHNLGTYYPSPPTRKVLSTASKPNNQTPPSETTHQYIDLFIFTPEENKTNNSSFLYVRLAPSVVFLRPGSFGDAAMGLIAAA